MDRETDLNHPVAPDRRDAEGTADMVWKEHGWGLTARDVAILVGSIIVLSAAVGLFG